MAHSMIANLTLPADWYDGLAEHGDPEKLSDTARGEIAEWLQGTDENGDPNGSIAVLGVVRELDGEWRGAPRRLAEYRAARWVRDDV